MTQGIATARESGAMLRQRRPQPSKDQVNPLPTEMARSDNLTGGGIASWSVRSQWMFFAVASGACAAFNGVFAKLTTTELTTKLSNAIASGLGLSSAERIVEIAVRGIFFALNLTFNGVMWSLFTTALARGTSTTQVSIMNTSTNFMLTAFLGLIIFSESLPPMWWAGAALLVAGNVIIGRKDETKDADGAAENEILVQQEEGQSEHEEDAAPPGIYKDEVVDEDIVDLGEINTQGRS
uniref:EamA domain-containing protein n=1 Tax=Bionectria ochroleuca TaxID=29856 RepID=A0A8H7TR93_BIOOC